MANATIEKENVSYQEDVASAHRNDNDGLHTISTTVDANILPAGYFHSRHFLGSMLAVAMSLTCTTAAFGYAAPILDIINAAIGPDANYVWISLVYTVSLSVSLVLVGRITDIFGRRGFVISFTGLGVVGSVVCATANTVPVLIGGNVLLGVSTAAGMSYPFLMGELVPLRHRFLSSAVVYIGCFPGSGFGPVISYAMVEYNPGVGWRGIYYILIAMEAATLLLWVTCYFPPTFEQKHGSDRKMDWLKRFGFVGVLLYSAGFVIFLFGISSGRVAYAWDSAEVISFLVVGAFVFVAFVLWECYAKLSEPFVDTTLFRNGQRSAACALVGIGAGVYHAFSIVWPQQIAVVYSSGDRITDGVITSIPGFAVVSGQTVAGIFATRIGHIKWQLTTAFSLAGIFLGSIFLVTIGIFFTGWNEYLAIALIIMAIKDQNTVGAASGVAGGIRMAISAFLSAMYSTILNSRLAQTVPSQVRDAIVDAGLPSSSVPGFLEGLTARSFVGVEGVTEAIIAAGTRAYKTASSGAYRTVFFSTIAVNGIGVILTFFVPDPDLEAPGMAAVAAPLNESADGKGEKGKAVDEREMAWLNTRNVAFLQALTVRLS